MQVKPLSSSQNFEGRVYLFKNIKEQRTGLEFTKENLINTLGNSIPRQNAKNIIEALMSFNFEIRKSDNYGEIIIEQSIGNNLHVMLGSNGKPTNTQTYYVSMSKPNLKENLITVVKTLIKNQSSTPARR
jgi:hypothetical protein